jgi:hypothetical protein
VDGQRDRDRVGDGQAGGAERGRRSDRAESRVRRRQREHRCELERRHHPERGSEWLRRPESGEGDADRGDAHRRRARDEQENGAPTSCEAGGNEHEQRRMHHRRGGEDPEDGEPCELELREPPGEDAARRIRQRATEQDESHRVSEPGRSERVHERPGSVAAARVDRAERAGAGDGGPPRQRRRGRREEEQDERSSGRRVAAVSEELQRGAQLRLAPPVLEPHDHAARSGESRRDDRLPPPGYERETA